MTLKNNLIQPKGSLERNEVSSFNYGFAAFGWIINIQNFLLCETKKNLPKKQVR